MTSFQRVYLSTNRLEWWNGHLATALAREVEVVSCPMGRPGQIGHPAETDITELVKVRDGEKAFYLGSVDQIFRHTVDLPIPTAIWSDYCAGGSFGRSCLPLFDMVFCTQKDSVAELKQAGIKQVEWLPFAFDTTLKSDPSLEKIHDVGFVGSLELPATRGERIEILSRLEQKYRLNDYRRPVYGDGMMRVYNQSRIVVNIPVPGGFNMRTFEAMASGALLLTKRVGNGQEDLFRDGVHLVTYTDAEDLMGKIDYYLCHENERAAIAAAGRQEVLSHHTYDQRAARVLTVMRNATRARPTDRRVIAAAYRVFYRHLRRPDMLGYLFFARDVSLSMRLEIAVRALWIFWRNVAEMRRGNR